ncbi:phosphate/phosphite/phosphonate ABC transporter substrate-binding protein [Sulfitobacter aestuarii]|uniref:Phosphate/phosphite/phosphonate ABC transporter substrate-binding protein n=1 Tax=Sulfitobacter aestuarii TaxID=2161676 RepID=A0ABW5U1G6_9RHOB
MIASLMMYRHSATSGAEARYWSAIRGALAVRGIDSPAALSNDAPPLSVWRAPDLLLSQTCGLPLRLWLRAHVTLIGTPDYGLEGCPPGYYRSAFVVRRNDPRETLSRFRDARFVYNDRFSQSGFAAAHAHAARLGIWFRHCRQSHGHLQSARAVAEGRADIAALDAMSWRLIRRHEPFADRLRVLDWSAPSPGLPYISARGADRAVLFEAISVAIDALAAEDRAALGLCGLVDIPLSAYLRQPVPPDNV